MSFKLFLENINNQRDELTILLIGKYWPQIITPNHLTYFRVFIAVFIFMLLFILSIDNKILILSLFSIGALTDSLDGSIARKRNKITKFGTLLDPIADRFLIIPVAVYTLYKTEEHLLLALALAEVINSLFVMYYKIKGTYFETDIYGKTKMFLLCIGLISILIFWPHTPPKIFIYLLWTTIIFSFVSTFSRINELKTKHAKNTKNI